ncbi:mitoguardin 2 [Protopterus annectens]|uniref:mitoguardin 2 n=1 Tax=Protopterus annectens TaxID=7888 RepID=UPI001CFB3003|nr:mitoguardin 2 [Protopterus annectens]
MALRRADGVSIMQALAMTVAEIPVFLYSTFGQSVFSQLRLSPKLKKVLFATALGSVALALAAHHLKRRRRRKKQLTQEEEIQKLKAPPGPLLASGKPLSLKRGYSSRRVQSPSSKSNDTLSGISSIAPSKHSSSSHSLASVHVTVNSPSPETSQAAPWETKQEECQGVEDISADNLYFMGMELFEEALHKWEQALSIRQRRDSETQATQSSVVLHRAPVCPSEQLSRNRDFAHKLESLLHRAYTLQEEFGARIAPENFLEDFESEGTLILPQVEESERLRTGDDDASLTSDESFFSAAEFFEAVSVGHFPEPLSAPTSASEPSLSLEPAIPCQLLQTELLECYSDQDFLAKLHCVRAAFEILLQENNNRLFFAEVGKKMITGLMIRAEKNPQAFLESYDEMVTYIQREETWPTTQIELEGRGVVSLNFFDIALDFILMDAFEDLENPPSSVVAVLRNRWLSDSFKETALATACWSVLKAKRRLLRVPDGFISHFYSVSEHVSPVLAFGFLGPKQKLCEVCSFFKHQILQYLKDMFDLDKLRYTTVQSLAEDIHHLSQRRSEILLGYLGIDTLADMNGAVPNGNTS